MRRETFVPQSYVWAQEAQVDWYEAWVDFGDERTRVQVFAMRSVASGAAFHRAYLHATQRWTNPMLSLLLSSSLPGPRLCYATDAATPERGSEPGIVLVYRSYRGRCADQ